MTDVPPTRLRVLDWNINGFAQLRGQGDLIASLEWDVCTLQEVTEATWPDLRELADHGAVALEHLPSIAGRLPRYFSAVLVRNGIAMSSASTLSDVPSRERTLTAEVVLPTGRELVVASLASPPGVSWGTAGKGRQVTRVAAWLQERSKPTIVGMDANAPKFERLDPAETEWWNADEPLLFGEERTHDLRDVFREVVSSDPERWSELAERAPEGPLAVSYDRGKGDRHIPCRYDVILASPEFAVEHVEYRYEEALEAGSDHGLIEAALTLT